MQVKQFIVDLGNENKKVYTVFYNEDGKVLQIDILYFRNGKLELESEETIYAIEAENEFYNISDLNLEVLEKIWIKYEEEYDENFK
jgi:hypothetical protein